MEVFSPLITEGLSVKTGQIKRDDSKLQVWQRQVHINGYKQGFSTLKP